MSHGCLGRPNRTRYVVSAAAYSSRPSGEEVRRSAVGAATGGSWSMHFPGSGEEPVHHGPTTASVARDLGSSRELHDLKTFASHVTLMPWQRASGGGRHGSSAVPSE